MDKYGIHFAIVPLVDAYLATTPVPADAEILLMAAPAAPNSRVEVVSVDIVCLKTLVVDGSNQAIVDTIKVRDASADSDTTIFTGAAGGAGDLLTAVLDLYEPYHLWHGSQSLDPGDSVRAVLDTTTPDTAGVGYFFIVGYRIKEWNGQ